MGERLQNLIFLLVSQNVFFNYFLNLKRPQTRSGSGSVGLSTLECACAKTFFLGDFASLLDSLFSERRTKRRHENSNEKPNDYHDKKLRPLRGSQKIHRDNPKKQEGCFDL